MNASAFDAIGLSVRLLTVDAIEKANSGHPGLPLGCAELGGFIFGEAMSHYPQDPLWANRDRFILSAGHGSMLLYALLHLSGYDLGLEDLKRFRTLRSKTPGHPEYGAAPGIETTTGPLGQGFGNAVGIAIAERMLAAQFNTTTRSVIDHYTYVLAGDGDMMEGVVYEAASLAGHLGLGKLIVFYDDNQVSIDGATSLTFSEDVMARFAACNWQTFACSAYDLEELRRLRAEGQGRFDPADAHQGAVCHGQGLTVLRWHPSGPFRSPRYGRAAKDEAGHGGGPGSGILRRRRSHRVLPDAKQGVESGIRRVVCGVRVVDGGESRPLNEMAGGLRRAPTAI